jgi:hydroxymethylglutaryl-CoA reductase (NADPH)
MTSLRNPNDFAERVDTGVLRYSRVWEDHRLLDGALEIDGDSDVISIASAGCNVLSLLLQDPASVTAVDVGESQLAVVGLQLAAIPRLSAAEVRRLLGVVPGTTADRLALYDRIRPDLPLPVRRWCDGNPAVAEGLAFAGRLERHFHDFTFGALRELVSEQEIRRFAAMDDLAEQRAWFDRHLDTAPVEAAFRANTAAIGLSGRDPEQFRYVGGDEIGDDPVTFCWGRFRHLCTAVPAAGNPYLHAYLLGPDAQVWPAHLTDEGHALLQERVGRVELRTGEIVAVVADRPVGAYSHANLSDIFEYLSPVQTAESLIVLGERLRPGGRVAFWNHLVDRSVPTDHPGLEPLPELATRLHEQDRSCVYRAFHVAAVRPRVSDTSALVAAAAPTDQTTRHHRAGSADRRRSPRVAAGHLDLSVVEAAVLPGGGSIVDVSPTGLAIAVADDCPLGEGDELHLAKVRGGGAAEDAPGGLSPLPVRDLPPLAVGHRRRVDGRVHLTLTELDGPTGRLWELFDAVRSGEIARPAPVPVPSEPGWRPPRIPGRGHYSEEHRLERLAWITAQTGADTSRVATTSLDAAALTGNIENLVGGIEVPVGLAGPLWFNGEHVQGLVTAPYATTEGALVASVCRGATAISRSGGVSTRVVWQRMTRAPLYTFDDIDVAIRFTRWLQDHIDDIRAEIATVSSHARLLEIDPVLMGVHVHVRFVYETGDAAGQNMTTISTWRACQWIEAARERAGLPAGEVNIDANMSSDKKVSQLSMIAGRGTRVLAECRIDRQTLADVLKVTPEGMERGWLACVAGNAQSGMVGATVNLANTIAGIFTATGQDIASVHESAVGIMSVRAEDDGLHLSLVLPSLIVGTIGGGTTLPGPQAYLQMLGCGGGHDRSERLAEIIAGFALALDVSTMAALVGGQFADAHERLGRNKPVDWFTEDDLTPGLFTPMMAAHRGDDVLTVTEVTDASVGMGSSIVTELVSRTTRQKLVGIVPRTLHLSDGTELDVVVKSKPLDREITLLMGQMASLCGGEVASYFARWQRDTGFTGTHTKELAVAGTDDPRMRRIMPQTYGTHRDDEREAYVLVMEALGDDGTFVLKDTADDVAGWGLLELDTAVRDLAGAHAVWLGREDELVATDWIGPVATADRMAAMRPLWSALAEHGHREMPTIVGPDELATLHRLVNATAARWSAFEAMPRTLVHHDCNPRNLCLRVDEAAPTGLRLVAYDWELATLHVPQYDLAELLAFTLEGDLDPRLVGGLVELHRQELERASGVELSPAEWRRGFRLALEDFMVRRLNLYVMGHTFRDYGFLERLVATANALLAVVSRPGFEIGGDL